MAVSDAAPLAPASSTGPDDPAPTAGRLARVRAVLSRPAFWLWLLALLAVTPEAVHALTMRGDVLVDLHVYRQAGVSLLHHRPVYAEYVNTQYALLPFTYPPVAAVLAVPLALLPLRVDGLLWILAVFAVLAWSLRLLLVPVLARVRTHHPRCEPLVLPAAFVGATYLLPVHQQLRFGQVGMFLLGLVLLDLLTPRTGRFRGVLVGVATAIKLTPGLYIVAFLAARKWREAAMTTAGFLGVVGLTWLIAPGTSRSYWTDNLFHAGRLGDNASPANQSLRGVLLRTGLTGTGGELALLAATVVVGGAGLYVTTKAWRSGDELLAVGVAGLLSCLLSPVAWTHHYVYLLPLLAWLLRESRYVVAGLVALLWSFDWAAHQLPHMGQAGVSGVLWQLLGAEFVLCGVVLVGWLAVRAAREPADPRMVGCSSTRRPSSGSPSGVPLPVSSGSAPHSR